MAENPWETWTTGITVTDPAWIEHLSSKTPFGHQFSFVSKPKPWDEDPLTFGD